MRVGGGGEGGGVREDGGRRRLGGLGGDLDLQAGFDPAGRARGGWLATKVSLGTQGQA